MYCVLSALYSCICPRRSCCCRSAAYSAWINANTLTAREHTRARQAAGENYAREGADEAYGPGSAGDFDAWPAGGDNKGVEKPNGDER